jgi:co-chaperonin GroES (HSP10)
MITPLRDFCLLEKIEENITPSGLHLATVETVTGVRKAKVVAVGPSVSRPKLRYFVPKRDGTNTVISAPDPDTHVFYVDVGATPPDQVSGYMDKLKDTMKTSDSVAICVGDTVFYSVYGCQEVDDTDGKKYLLAPEKEILAVIA